MLGRRALRRILANCRRVRRSGQFRWMDAPDRLALNNEGAGPVDLVEIEVF